MNDRTPKSRNFGMTFSSMDGDEVEVYPGFEHFNEESALSETLFPAVLERLTLSNTIMARFTTMPKRLESNHFSPYEEPVPENGKFISSIHDEIQATLGDAHRLNDYLKSSDDIGSDTVSQKQAHQQAASSEKQNRAKGFGRKQVAPKKQTENEDDSIAERVSLVSIEPMNRSLEQAQDKLSVKSSTSWETIEDNNFKISSAEASCTADIQSKSRTPLATPTYNSTLPLLKPSESPKTSFGSRKKNEFLSLSGNDFPPLGGVSSSDSSPSSGSGRGRGRGKKPPPTDISKFAMGFRPLADPPLSAFQGTSRDRKTSPKKALHNVDKANTFVKHEVEGKRYKIPHSEVERTVVISRLPKSVKQTDIHDQVSAFGEIEKLSFAIQDRNHNHVIICMADTKMVDSIIDMLNGSVLEDKITLTVHRPKLV